MVVFTAKIMSEKKAKSDHIKIDYRLLKAADIEPRDDAFHGNINLLDIEWWYFDAVFDNGYSIHIGVRTSHIRNSGIVQSRINIYKKGKVEVETIKTHLFSNFYTSYDRLLLRINDKPIIEFDQEHYEKTGEWRYNVSLTIDHHAVDLTFTGTTKGWKIETSDTCWTVALPKAKVTGTITVNKCTISVKGVGYHDHNWGYSPTTSFNNLGWFWGKITGDTLTVTWAKTMQSNEKGDLLAIVNQDRNKSQNEVEFYSTSPGGISFTPKNFVYNHRRWIPTEFDLQITDTVSDDHIPMDASIHMKTVDIQHTRIFTAHYWRYHIETTGKISVGCTTETLDGKLQIIEFLSFKPQSQRK